MPSAEKDRLFILPPPHSDLNVDLDENRLPIIDLNNLIEDDDGSERILIGLKGFVFDVTVMNKYFGANKPLSNYASRDISYALARYSNLPEDLNVQGYADLSVDDLEVLNDWVSIFLRFEVIGKIRPHSN
ncbi:hypothetical protein B0H17DRAFT_1046379 [Mycena rosella]|uniref:Cytochrome b5 heme-binding domain-containing protein n=1 Tax=Mycena rosella TaxID=1033263 RepID=A0AAD7DWF9_MYCRO|nr:hypothetical protein B0H17DRAFT_1046379 [Mycena rosella]